MVGILGVTGTPGTGKKSVASLTAKMLGVKCLSINGLGRSLGPAAGPAEEETVDTEEMRKKLATTLRGPALVFGHLLPYVFNGESLARVAVLRCEPSVLRERLRLRGYPAAKVVENVEAELIGVVSSDAFDAFGRSKTFEVDTSHTSPADAAASVVAIVRGESRPEIRIDWTLNYDSGLKLRSLLSGA